MRLAENQAHLKSAGFQSGEKNPMWNGGKRITNGHVLIAERALGRKLPEKAQGHHVNHIRHDNRNDNLVICEDDAYHKLIHLRERAYLATGNPKSRKCKFCKQWGLDVAIDKAGNVYHRTCRKAYRRERSRGKKETYHVN